MLGITNPCKSTAKPISPLSTEIRNDLGAETSNPRRGAEVGLKRTQSDVHEGFPVDPSKRLNEAHSAPLRFEPLNKSASVMSLLRVTPPVRVKTACASGDDQRPKVGVLRLDGWGNQRITRTGLNVTAIPDLPTRDTPAAYVPIPGDIDHAESFQYPAVATVARGCSWEALKEPRNWEDPHFLQEIKDEVAAAFEALVDDGVHAIVANCGLFMWLHATGIVSAAMDEVMAGKDSDTFRPMVRLSSLTLLSSMLPLYGLAARRTTKVWPSSSYRELPAPLVVVFTSNEDACLEIIQHVPELFQYRCFTHKQALRNPILKEEGGILVVGLNGDNVIGVDGKVDGFEVVNDGTAAYFDILNPSIQKVAEGVKKEYPGSRMALVECTEVSAYTDTIRDQMQVPVYDPISLADTMLDACIPHDYMQSNHEERQEFIKSALETPTGTMGFDLTYTVPRSRRVGVSSQTS